MGDYDLNKKMEDDQHSEDIIESSESSQKKKYFKALFVGIIVSILVGVLLAIIAYVLKKEYIYLLIAGALIISSTIGRFVPRCSAVGAILGCIFTPIGYLVYYYLMQHFGYNYEGYSDRWFYALVILSAGVGALLGYNAFKREEE